MGVGWRVPLRFVFVRGLKRREQTEDEIGKGISPPLDSSSLSPQISSFSPFPFGSGVGLHWSDPKRRQVEAPPRHLPFECRP